MKWTLSVTAVLMLFGCGVEQRVPPSSEQSRQTEAGEAETLKRSAPPRHFEKTTGKGPVDGGLLFAQKCAACHGQYARKSALGYSRVIAGWKREKIAVILNGYKKGSYGGSMKALMQAQVKLLSREQIDALAKRISQI